MKRLFLAMFLFWLLVTSLPAVPGLISYQGMLRDDGGHSITTATDLTFTFWDQESGGNQLGGAFSDTDTVTPDSNGLFTTLIGDAPTSPVPEAIFSVDDVWLNVNAGGVDLSPRTRITSVGFAVKASSADRATTAAVASVALSADRLNPALNQPGDRFNLGNNTWFEVGPDGNTYLQTNGRRYGSMQWFHPKSPQEYISPNGYSAINPRVAMDANDNAIVVWEQADGVTQQIFKSEYTNGVWTHPSNLLDNISPDGGYAEDPEVAMDRDGNAIIVWRQSDGANWQIFKSERRNGIWTHPSSLSDNISQNGQDCAFPFVAMNRGSAIIAWHQFDGADYQIFMSEYRMSKWKHPKGLSDNISVDGTNAQLAHVAMDDDNNAMIVWEQSDGARYQIYKSEYRNNAWTHPVRLSDNISPNGQDAHNVQLRMDNNGNAIIVWDQSDGSVKKIFKSEYRGGDWTHPSSLADAIVSNAFDPQVAMDDNGNALIAWIQNDGVNDQVFLSEYRSGVWKYPDFLFENISPDGSNTMYSKAAMDDHGNAIVVWAQDEGSTLQIFKSEYRGGVWYHPANLMDNISPVGPDTMYPQIAMSKNGNAMIVWHQKYSAINRIYISEYCWGF